MASIKKTAVSTIAAAAVMTSALSLGASAYSDSGTWNFYSNPNTSNTVSDFNLNYYNGGYRAKITEKTNGGASNQVIVYTKSTDKDGNTTFNEAKRLTEVGVPCASFSAYMYEDRNGSHYAAFRVKLSSETSSNTVTNKGIIQVGNLPI